jgi:hypothetical protein
MPDRASLAGIKWEDYALVHLASWKEVRMQYRCVALAQV